MLSRMDFVVVQDVLASVRGSSGEKDVPRVVAAVTLMDKGATAYHSEDLAGSVALYEQALSQLINVDGADVLRAMIRGGLVACYARTGRFAEAIGVARAAMPVLRSDPRLAFNCANCIHDFGAALSNTGRLEEGVSCLQEALAFYESDSKYAALAEMCRQNIQSIERAARTSRNPKTARSWWHTLFRR